ncbi:GntR family transcriptional regulator [Aneurinibacillus migulanus]|uniref:HTH gntR-type domain-containing protein n=1 Tax=Aneurinibacillus migulanus TaxID=47500 RepID=A0A0D1Y1E7_ANEMI|nr:GntR family transcriptional regulator [Aneurinibacillus migulanus]KIV60366.1 hypothetical protein TS65_00060 [Aneurinibacillus migulanus]KON94995.1 hypothetical protein AF333_05345 [Aneurinibacillus migulanus]MED0895920.1 GntR family transcriptional regulator [Aneurinibacillus migulanus]MED1619618.1 GntR family transcriptional regulator [Aneurinibacillus migulanus]GED16178.1 hypothetical protein AMI01nite_41690 [Aneurinibacillus migulanus]
MRRVSHSDVPIYEQSGAYIKGRIAYGEWAVGYKLPTERTFAKQLGVNRGTVAAAFAELAAEGLIEGRRERNGKC